MEQLTIKQLAALCKHEIAKGNGKSGPERSPIGQAVLPLYKKGIVVSDELQLAPVKYKKSGGGGRGANNSIHYQIPFDSAVVTVDRNLSEFLSTNGSSIASLASSDVQEVLSHFFAVTECLTTVLNSDTKQGIDDLVAFSEKVEPALQDKLDQYLVFFAENYVTIEDGTEVYKNIMTYWAELMENDDQERRKDDQVVGYLLAVLTKSFVVSKNLEFGDVFQNFRAGGAGIGGRHVATCRIRRAGDGLVAGEEELVRHGSVQTDETEIRKGAAGTETRRRRAYLPT